MVCYIYDQGARVSTPAEALFRPGGVNQTQPSARSPAVRPHEDRPAEHEQELRQYRESQAEAEARDRRQPARHARDLMSHPVTTITRPETVTDAWRLFARHRFHHLPVVDDGGHIVGILSDRDLLRASYSQDGVDDMDVGAVMTRRVISAIPEADIRLLAELMLHRRIGAVPITDDTGRLEGIVTRADILRLLVTRGPFELWV